MKKILTLAAGLATAFCLSVYAQEPAPAPQAAPVDNKSAPAEVPAAPAAAKAFGLDASIGAETIDGIGYMVIAAQPDLSLGKFGIGLDIVLRLDPQFRPYKPDWNSWDDVLSKLNYVRWARKGDRFFAKIGLLDDVYLGHGAIFYRYSNKLFLPTVRKIGLQFDLDLTKFGFELFDNDLWYNEVMGGRVYYRPFAKKLTKAEREAGLKSREVKFLNLNKWAIGVTAAGDIKLRKPVGLLGADLDLPVLDWGSFLSVLLYADFVKNFEFPGMEGTGVTPGFQLTVLGFKFVGEYHIYQKYFNGPYFDYFYELDRKTKLASLKANNTNATTGWGIKMSRDFFGWVQFAFDLSDSTVGLPAMHFEAIMLKKVADKVKAGFAFDRMNIKSFQDAFSLMNVNSSMNANVLYSISPVVDLILNYNWSFARDPVSGKVKATPSFSIQTKFAFF